ncbi:MAG: PDZ domain-containing protein, partial [Sphingomonadales bacterium]
IGFAIPANLAETIIAQLIEQGSVKRGWLGVSFQPVTRDMAESLGLDETRGALVASVTPGGPADEAGLQSGDVIVEFNGEEITERRRLPGLVANTEIGVAVKVVVLRKEDRKTLTVTIAERDEEQIQASLRQGPGGTDGSEATVLGLTLATLTDDVRESLAIDAAIEGAVIMNVEPGSHAEVQGLQRGDVVVSVSLEDVASPEDVIARVEAVRESGRPSVLFRIYRNGAFSHITVSLGE